MKQSNHPKVTVVTVTYNAEQYLEQTIKSVAEQDYPNIEYIIIDGASTDGTIDIIKKYEKYIIYWISEPDGGIYDAMNKAIDAATGEWINFMNAGDSFCEKNTLSEVIKNLDSNTDLICGDIYYLENNKKTYRKAKGIDGGFNGIFCCHQALFTKTNIMKEKKFSLEFPIAADYNFVLSCFVKKYNFQFINFPIVDFLAGGFSEQENFRANIESIKILLDYSNDSKLARESNFYKSLHFDSNIDNFKFSKQFNSFYNSIESLSKKYSKIALYGYGTIGKTIHSLLKEKVSVIFDKNNFTITDVDVYSPEDILNFDFEIIIIAVLGRELKIKEQILNHGVNANKIIVLQL
ncbi:hypothetical protein M947_08525 [Sulfurimonas hongkongensis]|uniref:Glycosyltransferase 2-like domain-containing protein n=2 Tax=Sulfurimonas hongkongensis TaxID=1172190 RepID=T0JDX3_9BACT|nr:hypothetical protein M947_08525 [Sulfurimonas hongkongensis]